MSSSGSSLRAFAGRFLIALVVGSLLMAGVVAGVDREVGRKLDRIPKINLTTAPPPPEGANYLLVGSDSRAFVTDALDADAFGSADAEEGQRSDTIMVVHIEPQAERTLIVSFPRDLWVNIPGHGYAKINAAYNYGPQAIIDTLKANFDIDVNHYVELNFKSFVGLVDTLGGVPVYVPYAAKDEFTGFGLPNGGCWPLDGEKALQYVRSRSMQYRNDVTGQWVTANSVPDIGRIERQQDFMRRLASIAVVRSLANPFTANNVADQVIDNLKADDAFDKAAVFDLLDAFRTLNPDDTTALEFATMPWKDGGVIQTQRVLLADMATAAPVIERLRTFDTRPRPTPDPATIRVRVVNASGRAGLGTAVEQRLEELGFVVTEAVDQDTKVADTSVKYAGGHLDKAKLLLRYFEPLAALDLGNPVIPNADVEVVIGKSFNEIVVPADRLDTTPSTAAPGDAVEATPTETVAPAPLDLPTQGSTVILPDPAPRGSC
ncbi:MAG: LCP family protein [Acidimicrobiia bacterium]|jgi:LCP family protein required for cell wall assembly